MNRTTARTPTRCSKPGASLHPRSGCPHSPVSEAYWEKGMFANQNSACKLRQEFTLNRLVQHFHLDELPAGE